MMTTEKAPTVEDTAEMEEHPTPPPGHATALASGCICPVWLNGYGAGLLSTIGAPPEEGVYLQHPDCRLHGTL